MIHQHLNEIDSTQSYLLSEYELDQNILISCDQQMSGHGRMDRKWDFHPGTLCCSFTLTPNATFSLTSIEIAVLIKDFIDKTFMKKTFLKWPNDLMTNSGKKLGGIIINSKSSSSHLAVGVGINFNPIETEVDYNVGSVFNTTQELDFQNIASDLYHYLLSNRTESSVLIDKWEEACIHLNRNVMLFDDKSKQHGRFIGLGKSGEALLMNQSQVSKVYSGSLRVL